jgi:hypothetical protein
VIKRTRQQTMTTINDNKKETKITERRHKNLYHTITSTHRQQTRTKLVHTPHERTNHGDFHTQRQIKIKETLTKRPTSLGQGKDTKKKHEKGSHKIGHSNLFSRRNKFQANVTNHQHFRMIRIITKFCGYVNNKCHTVAIIVT